MAKQILDSKWRDGAIAKKRADSRKTSQQILNELKRQARGEWGESPSVRTIERYLEKIPTMTPEQLRLYTYFSWPGSMTVGALPWEAGAAALELLRQRTDDGMDPPTIPLAYWYWRVSQVAPEIPIHSRCHIALSIVAGEVSEPPDYNVPMHWTLAYRGLYDADDKVRLADFQALEAARELGLIPEMLGQPAATITRELLRYLSGTARGPKPPEPKEKESKPKSKRKGRK